MAGVEASPAAPKEMKCPAGSKPAVRRARTTSGADPSLKELVKRVGAPRMGAARVDPNSLLSKLTRLPATWDDPEMVTLRYLCARLLIASSSP